MFKLKQIQPFLQLVLLMLFSQLSYGQGYTEIEYYHHDAQGSIVAASDENGDLLWQKGYDEYGNEVFTTENGDEYEGQAYTGAPYDEETGLIYLGQRYYDPELKRFISMDPVGVRESVIQNPAMFNRYAYANNNPYKYVDPDGRAPLFIEASNKRQSISQAMVRSTPFRVGSMVMAGAGLMGVAGIPAAACASSVCSPVAGVVISGGLVAEGDITAINPVTSIGASRWVGSGPTAGVLGVNASSTSVKAIQNFFPKKGSIEFVFDPKTKTFVVGAPKSGFTGSPHQQLARSIGADEATVVGGVFRRGSNGQILTNEMSGHFWRNWSPQVRQQFTDTMSRYGLKVDHGF